MEQEEKSEAEAPIINTYKTEGRKSVLHVLSQNTLSKCRQMEHKAAASRCFHI